MFYVSVCVEGLGEVACLLDLSATVARPVVYVVICVLDKCGHVDSGHTHTYSRCRSQLHQLSVTSSYTGSV